MVNPKMLKTRGDGVDIQAAVWEGAGRSLMGIHGLTANCRSWDTVAASLTPRYSLTAVDLRGRGRSSKPAEGYHITRHCRDLEAVMAHLGIRRPILMGHSLGALIALVYAARHPEQIAGLILIDGGGCLKEEQMSRVFESIKPALARLGVVHPSFEDYVAQLKQSPFFRPWSRAIENYFRYETEEIAEGVRSNVHPEHIFEEIQNLREINAEEYYPLVRCPTLILQATEDTLIPDDRLLPPNAVQLMLESIPDTRCVPVEQTNHYTILFQPSLARDAAIRSFVDSLA